MPDAVAEIEALGLAAGAGAVRAGIVACTGNAGCKFALADTKRHALQIADYVDPRLALDQPLNIHLTGCPNSCAQHYVGDIGLLATRVDPGGDADEVEGYHLLVGGGSGAELALARELFLAARRGSSGDRRGDSARLSGASPQRRELPRFHQPARRRRAAGIDRAQRGGGGLR